MSRRISKSWRAENTVAFLRRHGFRLSVFGLVFMVAVILLSVYASTRSKAQENTAIAFLKASSAEDFAALSTGSGGPYALASDFVYGRKVYDGGDYDKAAEVFRQFAADNPKHFLAARAVAAVGYCLERKGDFTAARRQFEQANTTETNPAWRQDNLLSIARCAEEAGNGQEALGLYRSFSAAYPDSIWSQTVTYRISLLTRK